MLQTPQYALAGGLDAKEGINNQDAKTRSARSLRPQGELARCP